VTVIALPLTPCTLNSAKVIAVVPTVGAEVRVQIHSEAALVLPAMTAIEAPGNAKG
jgi:hypothetical protein